MTYKITRLIFNKYTITFLLIILLTGLLTLCFKFRLFERIWFNFNITERSQTWASNSLWLSNYHIHIEKKPIIGIQNLSGLTWNPHTKTLFSVTNNPPQIIELSTTGEKIRTIPIEGIQDPETIEYIGDNHFIIADERRQKLVSITITPQTKQINTNQKQQVTLGLGETGNKGVEGLAWDIKNKRIYAAKERDPIHIYEITGFPQQPKTTMNIEVSNNRKRDKKLFIKDISGLDFNSFYQHLLVLSDESKLIIELDKKGNPISSLSLLIGQHGLTNSVPQAEGIAMDDQYNLYLISEPNLFYVFKK